MFTAYRCSAPASDGDTNIMSGIENDKAMPANKKKVAFDINSFCDRHNIGRTTFYRELKSGRLRAVRVGKRVLITADAAEEWLKNLPVA